MLDQALKQQYYRFILSPIINYCALKCKPLWITLIGLLSGLLFLPFAILSYKITAIALLILSGFCDTLDGAIARKSHQDSHFGAVLDIMADRVVEVAVIVSFYFLNPQANALAVIAMLVSCLLCITSFLVVGIFKKNQSDKSFHYSPGLIERAEAFIFFILMLLMPKQFLILAFIFSFLVLYTAAKRVYEFYLAQTI